MGHYEPMQTISASEAKLHFGALVDKAQKGPITIEKKGRPVVVVISFEDYQEQFDKSPTQADKDKALAFLKKWSKKKPLQANTEQFEDDIKAQAIWDKYTRS